MDEADRVSMMELSNSIQLRANTSENKEGNLIEESSERIGDSG